MDSVRSHKGPEGELTPARPKADRGRVRSVLVVDDHRTVADLLRMGIEATADLTCIGAAYDAGSAVEMAAGGVDVVVCDLNLGPVSRTGLALARELTDQDPHVAVLLLTGDPGELRLEDIRDSGASGLLAKDGDLAALLVAVRQASRERLDIDPSLVRTLTRPREQGVALTPREREVLLLMSNGRDVARISRELGIRPETCRGYVKALLHKLGAHSQLEAVARARAMGLLGRPS